MGKISINELAKQTGTRVDTIRYFEGCGMLDEPNRDKKGQRQYSAETVKLTKFIMRCQSVGFSLDEIRAIIGLKMNKSGNCIDRFKEESWCQRFHCK
jgi:DNA-binding transcriptional MerR regulator